MLALGAGDAVAHARRSCGQGLGRSRALCSSIPHSRFFRPVEPGFKFVLNFFTTGERSELVSESFRRKIAYRPPRLCTVEIARANSLESHRGECAGARRERLRLRRAPKWTR